MCTKQNLQMSVKDNPHTYEGGPALQKALKASGITPGQAAKANAPKTRLCPVCLTYPITRPTASACIKCSHFDKDK